MDLTVNQRLDWFDPSVRSKEVLMGAAEGCGVALQASCLEGFDTPGLHQVLKVDKRKAIRKRQVEPILGK
jgi:hypothetical protein